MAQNVRGKFLGRVSAWRKMAAVSWRAPDDPTIYGVLEVDMTNAREFLKTQEGRTGQKMTPTHLAVAALGRTLRKHPNCNALIRRGRIFERESVDIFVHVAVPPPKGTGEQKADLSGVKVCDADRKPLSEIAQELAGRARAVRSQDDDPRIKRSKAAFQRVPPRLLGQIMRGLSFVQYEWNLDLSPIGLPRDAFGSAMVTSVGMLGITEGFAPITPFTRIPLLILLGATEDRPVVREGEVVIRPMMRVTATCDHRLIDGFQAGRMSGTLKKILEDPGRELG